jgi:tetratricopeptide (TPR) repeat protein
VEERVHFLRRERSLRLERPGEELDERAGDEGDVRRSRRTADATTSSRDSVFVDYEGAAREFRTATEDAPRDYRAWDELCWALGYLTPPRPVEAERACRRAIELNPTYPEVSYHLARVLAQQGRTAEAEQAVAYLSEHHPGCPRPPRREA